MRFDTPHQRGRMIRWNARTDTARQLLFKDLAFPLSTLLMVAFCVLRCAPASLAPSQRVFSVGLASLMLSMGLSLTPGDIRRALLSPRFALRWWCCRCAARLLCFVVWLRFVWLSAIGAAASVLPRGDLPVRKPSAQDGDMTAPRD
jgi:predicted Na+-dependent transporter